DRFWYSYETRDGKKYYLVDPKVARGTKAPLFDAAQMAAKLASATLVPMDAQHLPIKAIKFINKDAALQLEVEVPKDDDIPGLKKPAGRPTTNEAQAREDDEELPQQRRGGGAGGDDAEASGKKSIGFEYELASGRLTLIPDFEATKKPVWASISP